MDVLGKRKREVAVVTRHRERTSDDKPTPADASDVNRDIFRKYFESTFEPLSESHIATPSLSDEEVEEDEDDEIESAQEESSWEGLSDVENRDANVEIVEHRALLEEREDAEFQRQQYKTFMVSSGTLAKHPRGRH